jgi:dipeptide/tripeptide permease
MFGGAGVIGLYTVGALIATVIMLLAREIDPWLAGLIVTGVLAAVAGVLALMGKQQVEQATPPAPERTIASVKEDANTIKTRAQAGRNG